MEFEGIRRKERKFRKEGAQTPTRSSSNQNKETAATPLSSMEQGEGDGGRKPDTQQLFQLLSNLLQEVEQLTNTEEVELRSKIEALGLEVTKLPSNSTTNHLDELEIATELDKLSAKLDNAEEMISSAMATDPQVQSLLSGTADIWMPVITATADERRSFAPSIAFADDNNAKGSGQKGGSN